ncbi:MAG: hypothetical protein Q8R01_11455, partial [Ramlibacter sp.]|nr:hypothetical protein [Ramlibacter sp.]
MTEFASVCTCSAHGCTSSSIERQKCTGSRSTNSAGMVPYSPDSLKYTLPSMNSVERSVSADVHGRCAADWSTMILHSGLTHSSPVYTSSISVAGMRLMSSSSAVFHPGCASPLRNQFCPLSA